MLLETDISIQHQHAIISVEQNLLSKNQKNWGTSLREKLRVGLSLRLPSFRSSTQVILRSIPCAKKT
jgi:hypothetical protein